MFVGFSNSEGYYFVIFVVLASVFLRIRLPGSVVSFGSRRSKDRGAFIFKCNQSTNRLPNDAASHHGSWSLSTGTSYSRSLCNKARQIFQKS